MTEAVVKQLCSGLLSGGVVGLLFGRREYILSYLTFTSVGLLDVAYHFNYLDAHVTHLTYKKLVKVPPTLDRFNELQRTIQREIRNPNDAMMQEFQWLINDLVRYVNQHIYFGMGFSMAFFLGTILVPKGPR